MKGRSHAIDSGGRGGSFINVVTSVNSGGGGGSMSLQATPAAAGKPSALLRERDPNQLASVQKSAGKRKMVCFEIKVGTAWHHRLDDFVATSARAGRAE